MIRIQSILIMHQDLISNNIHLRCIQVGCRFLWTCFSILIYVYIDNSGFYYEGKRYHTHLYVCVETLQKRIKRKREQSFSYFFFFTMLLFLGYVSRYSFLNLSLSLAFSTHERARMCSFFSSWLPTHTLFALNNTYTHFFSVSSFHWTHLWCVYSSNYLIFIFIILLVDPSSIDTLQQPQQQSDSNFAAHDHAAMLDTINHPQSSLVNPNHLQHPQSHLHQTMPGKTKRLLQDKKNRPEVMQSNWQRPSIIALHILRRVYAISLSACSSSLSL